MDLLFIDATFERTVDSATAWYQYLVPQLQHYWVAPRVCGLVSCPNVELPKIRTAYGQQDPEPLEVERILSTLDHKDGFQPIAGLGPRDCIYLKGASFRQTLAAVQWLKELPKSKRPRSIIQFDENCKVPGEEAELRKALEGECREHLKLVSARASTAQLLRELLQHPVEVWPNPQSGRKVKRRAAGGKLIALLGHHTVEKGLNLIPELSEVLLTKHPDAAVLVHDSTGLVDPKISLQRLEETNQRLVYMPGTVSQDRWEELISQVDVAVLPYDPDHFRDRQSWLLDEMIAMDVLAVVPDGTALASRLQEFDINGHCFDKHSVASIAVAVTNALAQPEAITSRWDETQGAQKLASAILSWFPHQRPYWNGWAQESASKRVLLSWSVDPAYIPPPQFSENQVTVGPHGMATAKNYLLPNRCRPFDAYTPFFHTYDLRQVLELQGIKGPFDLVVVFAESTFGNVPYNIQAFGCPTVLYAGDTHWGSAVIERMVKYATTAGFDYVFNTYNRQHLHWYKEAGVKQLAWIPALAVQHHRVHFQLEREKKIAFSGQTAQELHARRSRLLARLLEAGLPIEPKGMSREEAAAQYNSSIVSFNSSLNGDFNLRSFEVMSAAGCLITDRLTPESGQAALFEDGHDYLGYSDEQDLLSVLRYCLNNPGFALTIAANGHKTYKDNYLPEKQMSTLMDWIFGGKLPAEYGCDWDMRPQIAVEASLPLSERIGIYEALQESHRGKEQLRVLVDAGVPACVVADMIDLPRLTCTVVECDSGTRTLLRRYGMERRVRYTDSIGKAQAKGPWDYVIVRSDAASAINAPGVKIIRIADQSSSPTSLVNCHGSFRSPIRSA